MASYRTHKGCGFRSHFCEESILEYFERTDDYHGAFSKTVQVDLVRIDKQNEPGFTESTAIRTLEKHPENINLTSSEVLNNLGYRWYHAGWKEERLVKITDRLHYTCLYVARDPFCGWVGAYIKKHSNVKKETQLLLEAELLGILEEINASS